MIETMEVEGVIHSDTILIEPTSGNTGIGLAFIAATKGIPLVLVMPETASKERILTMKALGATVLLTPGSTGMKGAIAEAEELVHTNANYVMPQQFKHKANVAMHRRTTAVEILNDTEGDLSAFVAGVGTGGTISGVGEVLKERIARVTIVAVEPKDSPVLSGGQPGPHKIQGIGAGFIPAIYNPNVVDRIIQVSNEEAISMTKLVAKEEGLLVGISSGAALVAATILANEPTYENKNIVVLLPDSGERYLSTGIFDE